MPYLSLAAADPNKLIRHDLTNVDRYVPTAHQFDPDTKDTGSVRCKEGKCKRTEDPHAARDPNPTFEDSEDDFDNQIDPNTEDGKEAKPEDKTAKKPKVKEALEKAEETPK